jgi:fermentation-respiration switch protein FrsA (DUF1100 family)
MTLSLVYKILIFGGSLYLLLNLLALLCSDALIFVPQPPGYTHLPHEFKLASGDGEKINVVYLEHPRSPYTLLLSHGNAEDLSHVAPFMQQFYDRGYSVILYDYRGYGTSEGTPSVRKAYEDVEAVYLWLTDTRKIAPETILSQGRSVGGGPATWLAAHYPVGGLILESTFVSTFRVKTRWPLFFWDKFNNLKQIKKVECPVLVIHGREDTVIPIWHGRKLFDAAPGDKANLWIEGAQHNDYAYVAGPDYFTAIQSFVKDKVEPTVK